MEDYPEVFFVDKLINPGQDYYFVNFINKLIQGGFKGDFWLLPESRIVGEYFLLLEKRKIACSISMEDII